MEKRTYHEINQYQDTSFPVAIYRINEEGIFPPGRGLRDFHWHDELQFTFVVRGSLTIQVNAEQCCLKAGEAVFLNSGMIHAVTELSENGEYRSLNFPYKLLSFFPGSRMEEGFVLPYVTGGCLPLVKLEPNTGWQGEILRVLEEINKIWIKDASPENRYLISLKIAAIWYLLISNLPDEHRNRAPVNLTRRQRLQQMLSFIYGHFTEDVTLGDIADAAHISIGECCRIFREHLQTTPYYFLTEYRIRKSAELLSGELSVAEIARSCGYNQVSNYIAKFKGVFGCTPARYRKSMPMLPLSDGRENEASHQESGQTGTNQKADCKR